MKKIGIITFQNAHNYGAVLQLYALKTYLERQGYSVDVINYINQQIKSQYPLFPKVPFQTYRKKVILESILKIPINIVKNLYALPQHIIKYKKFNRFIHKIVKTPKMYHTKDIEKSNKYDAYICGSDQIWNPSLTNGLDPIYFCGFGTKAIKISYAASMGLKKLPALEEVKFQRLITNFDYLGVRESSLKDYISNFTNQEVTENVDPTLLLDQEDYLSLIKDNVYGKYIFVYSLVDDDKLFACAEKLSKDKNLPIIELRYKKIYKHRKYNQVADSGPEDFLCLIKNAEYVVTNSFHGTVFSIIFEKKFYAVYNEWGTSRLKTILEKVGLLDRYINDYDEIAQLKDIDFSKVKKEVKKLRKESCEFLKSALNGAAYEKVLENSNICTGCTACMNVCPTKAIVMKDDEKGFKYPQIDQSKCIHCDRCRKICPVNSRKHDDEDSIITKCLAVISDERNTSQSGGIGALLAKEFILSGGIVYGVILNNLRIIHSRIDNIDLLDKLKGSKYAQSNLLSTYQNIKEDLKLKRKVLFFGTPCQVAGLKSFIGEKYNDKLYVCDLICHGVVSPLIYEEYLNFMQKTNKKDIENIIFRDKKFGWGSHVETLIFSQGIEKNYEYYKNIFYSDNALRPSCYDCKFCSLNRTGDITIGDFWGIEKTEFKHQNEKGVSITLINTNKGKQLWKNIEQKTISEEFPIEKGMQRNLKFPTSQPKESDDFWNQYFCKGFKQIMVDYGNFTLKTRSNLYIQQLKKRIKKTIKKVIQHEK